MFDTGQTSPDLPFRLETSTRISSWSADGKDGKENFPQFVPFCVVISMVSNRRSREWMCLCSWRTIAAMIYVILHLCHCPVSLSSSSLSYTVIHSPPPPCNYVTSLFFVVVIMNIKALILFYTLSVLCESVCTEDDKRCAVLFAPSAI